MTRFATKKPDDTKEKKETGSEAKEKSKTEGVKVKVQKNKSQEPENVDQTNKSEVIGDDEIQLAQEIGQTYNYLKKRVLAYRESNRGLVFFPKTTFLIVEISQQISITSSSK